MFLKNGAMYSILALGAVMLFDAFGYHIPEWLAPVLTALTIGWFFQKSVRVSRVNIPGV